MIFTDQFVYVHLPKTGGTFVLRALARLYDVDCSLEVGFSQPATFRSTHGTLTASGDKHTACHKLPGELLETRGILSNIRNPLDLYVSEFEFGWWKRPERVADYEVVDCFRDRYPEFPDISFEQFLRLQYETYFEPEFQREFTDAEAPGLATWRFVDYYGCTPQATMRQLLRDGLDAVPLGDHIHDVHFLRTRRLNEDLHEFLRERGFAADDVEFILHREKAHPYQRSRRGDQHWRDYYRDELLQLMLRKDRLIFDLFPDLKTAC